LNNIDVKKIKKSLRCSYTYYDDYYRLKLLLQKCILNSPEIEEKILKINYNKKNLNFNAMGDYASIDRYIASVRYDDNKRLEYKSLSLKKKKKKKKKK